MFHNYELPQTFPVLRESLTLPHQADYHLTIETSKPQLTQTYREIARIRGKDPDDAEHYFNANVEFSFTHPSHLYPIIQNKLDRASTWIARQFARINGRWYAYFGLLNEDTFITVIPIHETTKDLAHYRAGNPFAFRVLDYDRQTPEERIASFTQVVEGLIVHEFVHIQIASEEKELWMQAIRDQAKRHTRIMAFALFGAATFRAEQPVFEKIEQFLKIAYLTYPVLRATAPLAESFREYERQVYEAQAQIAAESLVKKPLNLVVER
jgi:hypothetical protein